MTVRIAFTDHNDGRAGCGSDPRLYPSDQYDLISLALAGFDAVIIQGLVDQENLFSNRDAISGFLDGGGVVVWSGQLFRSWLPGCGAFTPVPARSVEDYAITVTREHPVFAGLGSDDLTFRHGVAGFFARGYHQPPPGVDVLAELPGQVPVVYVDRTTTGGTIFAHSGTSLLGWAEPGTPAERINTQLLDWIESEVRR